MVTAHREPDAPRFERGAAFGRHLQLIEDERVVARLRQDRDALVVLGGGAQQSHSACSSSTSPWVRIRSVDGERIESVFESLRTGFCASFRFRTGRQSRQRGSLPFREARLFSRFGKSNPTQRNPPEPKRILTRKSRISTRANRAVPMSMFSTASSTVTAGAATVSMNGYRLQTTRAIRS